MTLCTLCQSIDFNNLPALPAHYEGYHKAWDGLIAFLSIRLSQARKAGEDEKAGEFGQPLGVAHHQSIDELKAAAEHCSICRVIERGVSGHLAALAEAEQDKVYTYYRDKRGKKGPEYRFWITKRRDNCDGFLVVSPTIDDLVEVWHLAAVGFCVQDDDPLSSVISGRTIQEDSASERTLQRAVGFVQECDVDHAGTRCTDVDAELPSRVIDVQSDSSPTRLSLVEPQGEVGRYIALSHRWTEESQFATTHSKLESYKKGISLDDLPKTFQDVIYLARKLQVRYLWIDALCICQDDGPEWERESSKMAAIYSNAYLVVAATGAKQDKEGLFLKRSPPQFEAFEYTRDGIRGTVQAFSIPREAAAHPNGYCNLTEEPLSHRGWTLQERILASRTLHFASQQMFFECYGHTRSEDGFRMRGRVNSIHKDSRPQHIQIPSISTVDPAFRGSSFWYLMLQQYNERALTKSSDKLPALSGLARITEQQLGDQYVAGLWRSTLLEGLLWQGLGSRKGKLNATSEYRAPSWSWASIDGPVAHGGLGKDPGFISQDAHWVDIGTVLDCHVELKGENPYGEVAAGWVKIKAPVEPLTPSEETVPGTEDAPIKGFPRVKTRNGASVGASCMFDNSLEESNLELPLSALVLASIHRESSSAYQALIITPVEGKEGHYKRLGKLIFDDEGLGKCEWMEDQAKMETITLL